MYLFILVNLLFLSELQFRNYEKQFKKTIFPIFGVTKGIKPSLSKDNYVKNSIL